MYSILIIDDEKAIRENLLKAVPFEQYGFTVYNTAINGEDAIDKINQNPPDLILLDVCMPVMDGIDFLKKLRQGKHCDIKVIMLSGYSDFEYAKAAMRYGVKAYLNKPIDEEELFPLLEEIHKELDSQKKNISAECIREKIKYLQKIYRCGDGDRGIFKSTFLVHFIMLSSDTAFEEESPFDALKECIEKQVDNAESGYFRTKGSIYTYLMPEEILDFYDNNTLKFASHLQHLLKKEKLKCVVLVDTIIFRKSEENFRKDYDNHLYDMMTDVFFGAKDVIIYEKKGDKCWEGRFCREDQLLESLKKNILDLNWESVEKEFEGIIEEIESKHLNVEYLQEINYRIYYMLTDLMSSINETEGQEAFLQPLEWRENPFFPTLEIWKEIQYLQLKEVYSFVEKSRKISCMGVCGGVIEYVHRHFNEPITIKEVADCFFINAAYLGRAFKKATGKGFKQYVNDLRIAEAKRLLRQTDRLIYEIAETIGFNESKYFIAKFTSDVGVSPSEYRKNV